MTPRKQPKSTLRLILLKILHVNVTNISLSLCEPGATCNIKLDFGVLYTILKKINLGDNFALDAYLPLSLTMDWTNPFVTERHVCTHTRMHTNTNTLTLIVTHTHWHTHSMTHWHWHSHTHTHTHTWKHSLTNAHMHTHTITQTCTHTHTHLHAHTHTHTQWHLFTYTHTLTFDKPWS